MKNELITDLKQLEEMEGGAPKQSFTFWEDLTKLQPAKGGNEFVTMKAPSDNDNGNPFLFEEM